VLDGDAGGVGVDERVLETDQLSARVGERVDLLRLAHGVEEAACVAGDRDVDAWDVHVIHLRGVGVLSRRLATVGVLDEVRRPRAVPLSPYT
jgi:hypothetical protein